MATSDSRFKAFRFNPYSKPPPLPPKDPIYLGNNSSSIDFSLNSPVSPLPMNSPTPTSDRASSRKDKTFGFLKFPRRSPRSQNGDGSREDSIIIIGNDDLENPPPPEPDSQISTPWNFQHNIHVDEAYIGLPPSWATSLASAGFTPEEIADIQARRTAGSLAPDLRYLLTERPTSPQVAGFQSSPEVPILTNPTSRSASLPLTESARPTIPKLVTSSSVTRRPPPKRKPPLPTEELSQNGHKPSQSSLSTTHQSSDSHQSNPTASSSHSGQSAAFSSTNKSTPYHFPSASTSNLSSHSGYSTADEDGHTPLARAPLRPSPYSNNAHSHSSPAAQIPSTRFLPTAANAPSEFGVARNLEQSESEDRPRMDDRVVAPKSIWGTKRTVIPLTAKSNPSLSSLDSSTKTPSSSSTMPLYLQQQQLSQSALASSSFVAAASSSLSTLKGAAASTSLSIAAAVRNTKGVISRGLGTSKDNGNSGSVENKEDEESISDSLEIDATSGVDGEDALGGRKAVWQLYTRPKTLTDTSSRPLDVSQQQPTNTTNTTGEGGKIYLPFSKSQGSLRSLTRHVKKTSSQFSLSTQGSASASAVAAAPGSGTSGSGDVMLINKHQNSESIASSLESIPEAEGSAGLPPHSYTMASDTAASSSSVPLFKIPSVSPAELSPTRAPHLSLLHQNKGSLDLSLWSEALLSGLTRSTELDLGFTFRVGEKEAAEGGKGKARDNRDGESVTESEVGVTEMEKGGDEKESGSPLGTARPSGDASQPTNTNRNIPATAAAGMPRRYPPPARPIPPINDNDSNASASTSIPLVENPPSYPTGPLRSDSRSKPTGLTAPPSANLLPFSPPPNGLVAPPHHHHGYGQSPKPPPAVPLPPPPPSALSNGLTTTSTTAASAAMALRGIISPPPPSAAPFTTANMLSSPPSAHLPQSLKSPTLSTSPNSAQLWSEIDNMMDPGLMQRIGLTAAGGADGGFPRDGTNGPLKTAGGGSVLGQSQAQGSHFPAAGLELDADTSKSGVTIVTVGDVVGSSPDQSAALTGGFSPVLPFSPEEERVAATRVLRAGEGVLGTQAHGQEVERKHVEEREGDWGDSGYAERNLEEKREGSEGGDYSDQEVPIVHISRSTGPIDRLLIPDNHLTQRDNGNRDSSRSSSSTLTAEAVAVAATTIVRNVSRARRAGAVVLKGGSNVNSALLTPTPASSSNNGIRSRNSPSPPSATESKHPPSPLSSNFGNSSEESAGSLSNSLSPSSPSQDNYSTPTTDSASLASPLLYYLDGTQTPSPLPEKMAFGPLPPLPPAALTKPQSSGMNAQNEGDVDKYDYNYSPGSDDEEEDSAPFAYPDEATVEAVRASMAAAPTAAVPVPRPTIVISHEPPSTAAPATATTIMGTLSPFQQYRGWLSAVVAPLEEFIDECVDPRDHYLDLKEIAEGESGSVYSAYLNPATASKLRLSPLIKAKDEEEMAQHPEQVKLVAIKSVAIVPSGSPKLVDLQRELTLMKGLPGHENVLGMDGVYVDLVEDSLWVRMELMERSLADMVGLVGDGLMLPDRMLARFASDVLSALEYLQKHFIAHRDVRSDNLLLNKHGFLKLADFSNAVQVKKEFPMRSDLAGVIFWQAPEVRKPPYNVLKVDVWSLGATVWEMAQTEPPFSDTQHFGDRWPPLRQPELYSPAFHDFLRKCSEPALSRPNPSELLKHPFVQNACGRPVIVHLLSQCMAIERTLQERANASP